MSMALEAKRARMQRVIELRKQGLSVTTISVRTGLGPDYIKRLLGRNKITYSPESEARALWADRVWDSDEDKRREAFARRAARGARETLAALRQRAS